MLKGPTSGGVKSSRAAGRSKAAKNESPEEVVRRLSRKPSNKICCDCKTKLPQSVNMTHGSFVCMTCSGIHREYSHRVKGIGVSSFTADEADKLRGGNDAVNAMYMARYDSIRERMRPPENNQNEQLLKAWIRRKYVEKAWYTPDPNAEDTTGTSSTAGADGPTRVKIPPKKESTVEPVVDLLDFAPAPAAAPAPAQATNDSWDAFGGSSQQPSAAQGGAFNATFGDPTQQGGFQADFGGQQQAFGSSNQSNSNNFAAFPAPSQQPQQTQNQQQNGFANYSQAGQQVQQPSSFQANFVAPQQQSSSTENTFQANFGQAAGTEGIQSTPQKNVQQGFANFQQTPSHPSGSFQPDFGQMNQSATPSFQANFNSQPPQPQQTTSGTFQADFGQANIQQPPASIQPPSSTQGQFSANFSHMTPQQQAPQPSQQQATLSQPPQNNTGGTFQADFGQMSPQQPSQPAVTSQQTSTNFQANFGHLSPQPQNQQQMMPGQPPQFQANFDQQSSVHGGLQQQSQPQGFNPSFSPQATQPQLSHLATQQQPTMPPAMPNFQENHQQALQQQASTPNAPIQQAPQMQQSEQQNSVSFTVPQGATPQRNNVDQTQTQPHAPPFSSSVPTIQSLDHGRLQDAVEDDTHSVPSVVPVPSTPGIIDRSVSVMSAASVKKSAFDAFEDLSLEKKSTKKRVSTYQKGQDVMYTSNGITSKVVIAAAHHDDHLEPFYTIMLPDGHEKQTDDAHLQSIEEYEAIQAEKAAFVTSISDDEISFLRDMRTIKEEDKPQVLELLKSLLPEPEPEPESEGESEPQPEPEASSPIDPFQGNVEHPAASKEDAQSLASSLHDAMPSSALAGQNGFHQAATQSSANSVFETPSNKSGSVAEKEVEPELDTAEFGGFSKHQQASANEVPNNKYQNQGTVESGFSIPSPEPRPHPSINSFASAEKTQTSGAPQVTPLATGISSPAAIEPRPSVNSVDSANQSQASASAASQPQQQPPQMQQFGQQPQAGGSNVFSIPSPDMGHRPSYQSAGSSQGQFQQPPPVPPYPPQQQQGQQTNQQGGQVGSAGVGGGQDASVVSELPSPPVQRPTIQAPPPPPPQPQTSSAPGDQASVSASSQVSQQSYPTQYSGGGGGGFDPNLMMQMMMMMQQNPQMQQQMMANPQQMQLMMNMMQGGGGMQQQTHQQPPMAPLHQQMQMPQPPMQTQPHQQQQGQNFGMMPQQQQPQMPQQQFYGNNASSQQPQQQGQQQHQFPSMQL